MPGGASLSRRIEPSLFREYDARGIVGETLSVDDARAIGAAFATRVRANGGGARICTARDGRSSSPDLEQALTEGLAACGAEVVRLGRGPTPMLYFGARNREADGAVMVTGSHNPPSYNGFKFVLGNRPFFGAALAELGLIAAAGDFAVGPGTVREAPGLAAYVERLLEEAATLPASLAAVWDAGNGAAGEAVVAVTARMLGRHVLLNAEVDGTFPGHHPDPSVAANLRQLQDAVTSGGLDVGFAFDGDGDRLGVVDSAGGILWADEVLALLVPEVLAARPGATIIADVKCSQILFDRVAELGGQPIMWKTGHSLIKSKMLETGAPLAGEMSGHLFFADRYYGFDDALYAALRVLGVMARAGASLQTLRQALPPAFNTPEIRVFCPDERKFDAIAEVRARLEREGAEVSTVDGVRVRTAGGWWLARASNTEPAIVARCEAASPGALAKVRSAAAAALGRSGIDTVLLTGAESPAAT